MDLAAIVRGYYAWVDEGEIDRIAAMFAVDGVYERPGYPPLRGRDAIAGFYREDRVIASGRHVLSALVAAGDAVAVHGAFAGTLRDGRAAAVRFADFWSFDASAHVTARTTFFFAPSV